MGSLMLLPGTISANQNENNTESKSTKNSYIDTVKQTPVNEHELIKMAEDFKKENSLNMDENIKSEEAVKEENTNDKNEDDVLVHIIAQHRANTQKCLRVEEIMVFLLKILKFRYIIEL